LTPSAVAERRRGVRTRPWTDEGSTTSISSDWSSPGTPDEDGRRRARQRGLGHLVEISIELGNELDSSKIVQEATQRLDIDARACARLVTSRIISSAVAYRRWAGLSARAASIQLDRNLGQIDDGAGTGFCRTFTASRSRSARSRRPTSISHSVTPSANTSASVDVVARACSTDGQLALDALLALQPPDRLGDPVHTFRRPQTSMMFDGVTSPWTMPSDIRSSRAAVRVVQAVGRLARDERRQSGGRRPSRPLPHAQQRRQILAQQVLHRQEVAAVDLAEVVDLRRSGGASGLMRASSPNILMVGTALSRRECA
jgi:hypothetical protein